MSKEKLTFIDWLKDKFPAMANHGDSMNIHEIRQAYSEYSKHSNQEALSGEHECKYCGVMTSDSDDNCYQKPLSDESQANDGEVGKCSKCGDTENIVLAIVANSDDKICYKCWKNNPTLTQDNVREAAEMSLETMNILLNELPKDAVVLRHEIESRKKQLEQALNPKP